MTDPRPTTVAFIAALNSYAAIWHGREISTPTLTALATILHRIDRPGRRRRYLASTATPSIDGYIDFVTAEQTSTHGVG